MAGIWQIFLFFFSIHSQGHGGVKSELELICLLEPRRSLLKDGIWDRKRTYLIAKIVTAFESVN